ncbi:LysE family translocator [Thalassotalea euphylliae]|uniref:LysE family translocator n=1 Tax=Thalassotalea euphylliae TaxID=1655234 RepID=A0A3E0UFE9_9GAMM|nr:LysE family translocator [Thalassotalea euphylliae]REL35741.1 LysE family translocator [Thalassotalea euphylliae]
MIDTTLLAVFIPTIFFVSITPGMCMTLAMTLGMSIGVRRTLFMMFGELLGVASVAIAAVMGVAAVMLNYPSAFAALKIIGGIYLAYIGINMWRSKGKLAISKDDNGERQPLQLFSQGFVTAIANPKGWAFMVSLLPPFINQSMPLAPQLSFLVAIILLSEFICMMLYATGGKTIGKLLTSQGNVKLLNRISGGLMLCVALWLFAS